MSYNFWAKGIVGSPPYNGVGDGAEVTARFTREGTLMVAQDAGDYADSCSRGQVFTATKAAFTMPVIAASLASLFSLYNPINSGRWLELVDADISTVVATTVVDSVGLYYSTPALTALGTFTTQSQASIVPGNLGGAGAISVGQFWSSYTHSGTPVLAKLLGGWGATSDSGFNNVHYEFDGRVMVPPGVIVSLAMTTAASTASGITAAITWRERAL